MHNSWRTEGRSHQNQGILGTQGAQSITRSGKVCAPIIPRRIKNRATKEGCAKQSSLLKLHPFERPENVIIHCVSLCVMSSHLSTFKDSPILGPSSMTSFTSATTTLSVSKGDIVKVSEVQAGFKGRQRRVKGVAKKKRTNRTNYYYYCTGPVLGPFLFYFYYYTTNRCRNDYYSLSRIRFLCTTKWVCPPYFAFH